MKRILFLALTVLLAAGCYDDAALWDQIRDHEERIVSLEKLCNQMNTNISSLQAVVTALQDKDYVTNVAPIKENGKEIGYTITFSKSGSITIYHGNDGENGKDGVDGKDGSTPVIGVRMASDGVYYWTIDGEWLLDTDGNRIPTTGKDGADGADGENGKDGADGEDGKDGADGVNGKDGVDGITPQLKIEEDYWYISYDNGQTWDKLGKAVGEDGKDGADGADGENGKDGANGDSFFKSVTQDEENVYITLADGTEFVLPKAKQSNVTIWLKPLKDGSATFSGHVLNTSVDLKVTIYYSVYKDLTIYKYDDKVSVTDFPNNTFSLVLEGLAPDTQYYYFTEVVYNGTIEYSDIDTFVVPAFSDWEGVYFYDDFDWISEFTLASGAGDSMGINSDDNAKNAYTAVTGFAEALAAQGYEDLFPSSKTIYLQTNYLKFSKGKNVNGIRLPAVTYGGTTNVVLTFDWGVHVSSAAGADEVELTIAIEGNGSVDRETFTHTAGKWEWQTETVIISGVDDNTRIVLKPSDFTGEVASTSLMRRWYLDNIRIVHFDGEVPTPAPKTVFEEDFEWIDAIAVTEGAGDAVGEDNASATAPNVWKMASSADFFAKFNELGYKYLYSTVGSTEFAEGPAQEPKSDVGKEGSMYIQKNYLKFGQSSYNGALVLPALSAIEGTANVQIEFDWCWQVTSNHKPDIMTLSVDATSGQFADTAAPTSAALESAQSTVDGESHLAWQHVSIVLNGATAETVLTIRPTEADPSVQNPSRKQNRWYLDNIKVISFN